MDQIEAQNLDVWATKEHMRLGRMNLNGLGKQQKITWRDQMKRISVNGRLRANVDGRQHKPKVKEFGVVDKKNLIELDEHILYEHV